ncbi:TetR family transcriptional regulator [Streptomyces sp. SID8382]|uniref:TetR family transcriptional regulator n=1 Tax=Streptomyces malaysiensis TaxID=92644 RepID=UPI000C2B62FE|nr:TetR family transcriptional regulator [Streptomyces sp. M56]AUA13000.1 HTH-type transcriptional repressor NicS [Streptomyces sp. M56]MYX57819.1 TetR family transcriptional regulator [Streptomyces sp. SID8382]
MSPRKSDATRRRLLDAATVDFAAHGIAGARVDRIAAAAGINKAQLYAYFGDKLGLFGAVFRLHADSVVNAVPFMADDLPQYAVRLYDAVLERPELVRLAAWARLEGVVTDNQVTESPAVVVKLQAIAEAQRDGRVAASIEPQDVLALVLAMALTWSAVGPSATAASDDPPAAHDRRKQALSQAVSGAFGTGASRPPKG